MRLPRSLLLILTLCLVLVYLAGCGGSPPDQRPPAKETGAGAEKEKQPKETAPPPKASTPAELTAKEAWIKIGPYGKEVAGADAVLIELGTTKTYSPTPVTGGKSAYWQANYYSPNKKHVWGVNYRTFEGHAVQKGLSHPGKPVYQNVTLATADWTGNWAVDSPQAVEIAAEHGAGEVSSLKLQARGLEKLNKDFTVYHTPDFIPKTCNLFWVITGQGGYNHYLDASTGAYLGKKHSLRKS